jgi:hypothetical protein
MLMSECTLTLGALSHRVGTVQSRRISARPPGVPPTHRRTRHVRDRHRLADGRHRERSIAVEPVETVDTEDIAHRGEERGSRHSYHTQRWRASRPFATVRSFHRARSYVSGSALADSMHDWSTLHSAGAGGVGVAAR